MGRLVCLSDMVKSRPSKPQKDRNIPPLIYQDNIKKLVLITKGYHSEKDDGKFFIGDETGKGYHFMTIDEYKRIQVHPNPRDFLPRIVLVGRGKNINEISWVESSILPSRVALLKVAIYGANAFALGNPEFMISSEGIIYRPIQFYEIPSDEFKLAIKRRKIDKK